MQIFFLIIIVAIAYGIGCIGRNRKIGFGGAFILSIIFFSFISICPLNFNKPGWIKSVHQVFILKYISHLVTGNSLFFKYLLFSWNSMCRSLMYCIFILLFSFP